MGYRWNRGECHHRAKEPNWVVNAARELRERDGWTYRQIGELLEVPWRTVADWVNYRTR
jgi:hypothetical protein